MENNRQSLLNKIYQTSKNYGINTTEEDLLNLEDLLLEYLKRNPNDTDMWLRLAMLEHTPPLEDPNRIIKYLNNILIYDPTNPYALLILLYIYDFFFGKIPKDLFEKIKNISYENQEIMAMLEIAKSWYYRTKNNSKKYEESLLKSIKLNNNFASSYIDLGIFYINNQKNDIGKKMVQKGLSNIRYYFNEKDSIEDLTNIESFFDYYYKGIEASKSQVELIKEKYLHIR